MSAWHDVAEARAKVILLFKGARSAGDVSPAEFLAAINEYEGAVKREALEPVIEFLKTTKARVESALEAIK